MHLFLTFFLFELKLRAKSVSTYVYFLIFFTLSFLSVAAEDWSFVGPGRVLLNGPYCTIMLDYNMSVFGILVLAGIFGPSILRDFQHDTYQLVFTKPISKIAYLGGRWAGSLVTSVVVFSGLIFGETVGSTMPWADHTRLLAITPSLLRMYLAIFFDIPFLQIFFIGGIFFMVAALTRKMIVVYLQGVALFTIYLVLVISVITTRSLDRFVPSLVDPLGIVLLDTIMRYWTVVERNTLLLPWHGVFLYNRLIWSGIGILSLAVTYFLFPISAEALTRRRSSKGRGEEGSGNEARPRVAAMLPAVHRVFSAATTFRQLISLVGLRLRNTVRELPFWAIVLLMVVNTMIGGHFAGHVNDQNVWPVTALMLQVVEGRAGLFLFIVAAMYAGELAWRERDTHFEQIHDALPFHAWIDWTSKALTLCIVEGVLLTVVMLCGILSQMLAGYYRFELGQYFIELFVITLPGVLTFVFFALVVQSLVSNKYIGHAISVAAVLIPTFLIPAGFIDRLYLFDTSTDYTYSDMNGYGHFASPLFWSTGYWLLWSLLLVAGALALASRGTDSGLKDRLANARRSGARLIAAAALLIISIAGAGGWYFYNTHVLNPFRSDKDARHLQAAYETKYKQYENIAQPKIIAVDCKVNLYPERRSFDATGGYLLLNRSAQPITDVHISTNAEVPSEVSFDRPATVTLDDAKLHYRIYRLAKPLAPGEQMRMLFRRPSHYARLPQQWRTRGVGV